MHDLPPLTDPKNFENTSSNAIRPHSLNEYIGQSVLKKQLRISITASQSRCEPLDHVLLYGAPGLGKTSLAYIIAREMNSNIQITSGPILERAGDLAAILSRLETNDIIFIDEIHRMSASVEETLYSAMEDFKIDLMLGQGPAAQNIRIDVAPFTLIGATTRAGMLTSPLLDRFGIQHRLLFYTQDDLVKIITRSAALLSSQIEPLGAQEIASRSRGTPRIANRLLKRVRDYANVQRCIITQNLAKQALDDLEIDQAGLTALDRSYLKIIINQFHGGPVGVETLATAINEPKETLEDVIEPYLVQSGFLARTSRGRIATHKTYNHFHQKPPETL